MEYSATEIIQIITALSSFATVLGGTYIAVKQVGLNRKVDEAKVAAVEAADKLTQSTEIRAQQFTDLKDTVIAKAEEIKGATQPTKN